MELSTAHLSLAQHASIDLQLHTTYSDGTWMPEQLIDYLTKHRFGLAAITDHDRVDTAAALQALAQRKGFPLLVAAELTTSWNGQMTDILCYGFDPENNALSALTERVRHRQQAISQEVYANLVSRGIIPPPESDANPPEELAAILGMPSASQPNALAALARRHGCEEPGRVVTEAGAAVATSHLEAVVEAAHRSGAVCLVAHPGRSDKFVSYDVEMLDILRREVPIDGLEVFYPAHSPEQIIMYLEYARQHELLISSGSDSHGMVRKPIQYRAEVSRSLLERLGIHVS